jgi:uncharacterized Zn finger protein (UPF0148 family)
MSTITKQDYDTARESLIVELNAAGGKMTQLKPCPFCGNKVYAELEQQTRWICCPNCEQGIEGDADCITANALVELWNSRPAEDKLLADIANLQDWLGAWKESLDISMQTIAKYMTITQEEE